MLTFVVCWDWWYWTVSLKCSICHCPYLIDIWKVRRRMAGVGDIYIVLIQCLISDIEWVCRCIGSDLSNLWVNCFRIWSCVKLISCIRIQTHLWGRLEGSRYCRTFGRWIRRWKSCLVEILSIRKPCESWGGCRASWGGGNVRFTRGWQSPRLLSNFLARKASWLQSGAVNYSMKIVPIYSCYCPSNLLVRFLIWMTLSVDRIARDIGELTLLDVFRFKCRFLLQRNMCIGKLQLVIVE